EHRQGFVNNAGNLGELRRDEDDRVDSTAVYAQVEWSPWAALDVRAGVRQASVRFHSEDHYITAVNPDDSGAKSYRDASPVLGASYHVTERVNVYASYGSGFETRLQGVPPNSVYAEMAWSPATPAGFSAALVVQHQGQIF